MTADAAHYEAMAAHYEAMTGGLRALLIQIGDRLPADTVRALDELIDASEFGVALEILCEVADAEAVVVPASVVDAIEELARAMDLDPALAGPLRARVGSPDDP